jgi:HlyD family secretion protein
MNTDKLPPVKWLIGAAVLAAVVWFGRPLIFKPPAAPQYQTVAAKRQDITQAVTASGQLSATVTVEVGSQISGIIQKLLADYNTPVKAGQIVAQLDPATYRATKNQAMGELASAKASLELARLNEKRQRELVAGNAGPQADLDKAIADLNQAEAAVMTRQAQLDRATVDLDRCTITAPVDGVVISREVNEGQTVAATMQAPKLFTIANDLSKMQIEANVSEADIGGVKEGQKVDFTVDAFAGRVFEGTVKMVRFAPITVENVVTYVTVIEVANPKLELRPGMTANVSIVLEKRTGVIAVPNAALRYKPPVTPPAGGAIPTSTGRGEGGGGGGGGHGRGKPEGAVSKKRVHLLENGAPKAIEVEVGLTDGVVTEVLSGIDEGTQVITSQYTPGASTGPAPSLNPYSGGPPRR